uniref:Uncharacterized protein n=1 Tax=Myotis myotis TaxID=51298 RepID=A0A7J7UCS7_MYOMY|nr:hypothetical protein mMyoMyo1_008734 [Myotis myotis]
MFPQPLRRRSYGGLEPGFILQPLPHLLPLAVPGRPSSLLCHPDTSVPPPPSCHQQNLGTLRKLLPHPFLGSLPAASLPGAEKPQCLRRAAWAPCPSSVQARALGEAGSFHSSLDDCSPFSLIGFYIKPLPWILSYLGKGKVHSSFFFF